MELKKYNDYSDEEIKSLLTFWVRYYMKKMFTLDELEKLHEMIKEKPKEVFSVAVMLYSKGLGSTPMLDALRGNDDEITKAVASAKKLSNKELEHIRSKFLKEIVASYNEPKPDVVMDESDVLTQILEMFGINGANVSFVSQADEDSINVEELSEIINDVLFNEEELIYGKPEKNYVEVSGIKSKFILNAEKLEENRNKIQAMVDKLPSLDKARSLNELSVTKEGKRWALSIEQIEILLVLAEGCNIIKSIENEDKSISYIRSKKKQRKIIGKNPNSFPCVRNIFENKMKRELSLDELVECTCNNMSKESKELLNYLGFTLEYSNGHLYFHRINDNVYLPVTVSFEARKVVLSASENNRSISYSYNIDTKAKNGSYLTMEYVVTNILDRENYHDEGLIQFGLANNQENPDEIYSIQIIYINPSLEQKYYKYFINKDQISATINGSLQANDNAKNTTRQIYYGDVMSDERNECALHLIEAYANDEAYIINLSKDKKGMFNHSLESVSKRDKTKNGETTEKVKSRSEVHDLATNYLKTTRVKNLYNRVLEVLESAVPGLSEFIHNTNEISLYVEEIMKCEPNKDFEQLMNKCGIKEANIPGEEMNGPRRKKDV